MIRTLLARAGRKLFTSVGAIGVAMLFVGGAYATVGGHGVADPVPSSSVQPTETAVAEASETPKPESSETPEAEHGGSVERTHEGCGDTSALSGNWTHGDYVSGIAKLGDSDATKAAAHSDCGKPTHAEKEKKTDSHGKNHGKSQNHDDASTEGETEESGS